MTAALLGPRTIEQLDDLLAGAETVLSDEILDFTVPPGAERQAGGSLEGYSDDELLSELAWRLRGRT